MLSMGAGCLRVQISKAGQNKVHSSHEEAENSNCSGLIPHAAPIFLIRYLHFLYSDMVTQCVLSLLYYVIRGTHDWTTATD